MRALLQCAICEEPLGAYEPLVELVAGVARECSRREVPAQPGKASGCYHLACYERSRSARSTLHT